jgi:hypothetical protein
MLILVILSLCTLIGYLIGIFIKYGIPESISDSYYYLYYKVVFTIVIWVVGGFLLPPIMDHTSTVSETQIIPFIGIFGILLVGAAPRFKDTERTIHIIGATLAVVFSQLWIILYGLKEILFIWIIPLIILTINRKIGITWQKVFDKTKLLFWIELICFLTIYYNLLILL